MTPTMSPTPQSRVALVTGAAHGIGAGIARRLLDEGWFVYGVDRDESRLGQFADTLDTAQRLRYATIAADVGDEAAVADTCDRIGTEAGRLDGLVCNAGIMIRKPVAALTLAEWNRVLATNLTSTFLLARAAQPLLSANRDQGSIVTIASTRAHMSEPDTEAYAATKGGLLALTHALAISLGPRIRVNCISPGWIDVGGERLRQEDHAQHPAGRVGRVDDIADATFWLLRPESGFMTGSEIVIDGGMTRKMIYAE